MGTSSSRDLALSVAAKIKAAGCCVYFVGGCVRDELLQLPIEDYDLATDAPPEQLKSILQNGIEVGAHFGVFLVRDSGAEVEVATFRSDLYYQDGRRPEAVVFETDPRQDVLRRDFTINALLEDPFTGEILDFTHGRDDLRSQIIRAIGDPERRFAEDHLRMLRAIRFAARLNFDIEERTFAAIRKMASGISRISAERIRDELTRILTEGGARRGFELLDESGLLEVILPEVAQMKGVAQPPEFHPEGDVWTHTLMILAALRDPTPTLAWGALLHDVGKPPTFRVADRIRFDNHADIGARMSVEIMSRLRLSNEDIEQVEALVRHHLRFRDAPKMRESTLKRFLRLPKFEEHLELHRLDCESSHRRMDNYNFVRERWLALTPSDLHPPPLVRGEDLIAAGYQPGPRFREILEAVEELQLEGALTSREAALEFVRSRFPS
jgi:putative nucleotidyltransferase with HDIG domain